jgi:hypothetical protein
MSTHRYPLPDGRQLEINDPAFDGRVYFYIDGELLGENTIKELRIPLRFGLRGGSELPVHAVDSAPFFRTFDVRVDGMPLPRSASELRIARQTVIELLLLAAIVDCIYRMPVTPLDHAKLCLSDTALLVGLMVWLRLPSALQAANYFMLLHCIAAVLGQNGQIDLAAFGMYFRMRHLTSSIEDAKQFTPQPMPRVELS